MSHVNKPRGHMWIVKRRERMQWVTTTKRGPRRVWRMNKWKSVHYCGSESSGRQWLEQSKRRNCLSEWALFHKGKKVA